MDFGLQHLIWPLYISGLIETQASIPSLLKLTASKKKKPAEIVMLNLVQHLINSWHFETLKRG